MPIVDPMYFYYIDVIQKVSCLCGFGSGITLIGLLIAWGVKLDNEHELEYYEQMEKPRMIASYKRKIDRDESRVKFFSIAFSIMLVFNLILPSKETMNKMFIANYVTKENITAGVDFTLDVIEKAAERLFHKQKKEK